MAHGKRGLFDSDSYSDHGNVYKAYRESGYERQDDKDLVLDERITSHAEFAAFALLVPEWLETGAWHHLSTNAEGKRQLVLHTGRSHPNLPSPTRHPLLTSPEEIRQAEQAALCRLRSKPLAAEERAIFQLDTRAQRDGYQHVHKSWQARRAATREREDEDGLPDDENEDEDEEFSDEDDEGLDDETGILDDGSDDDEVVAAVTAAADEMVAASDDDDDDSECTRRTHLSWEVAAGLTEGFAAACAYLQTDEGNVKVADYMGSILDGEPHGNGRLMLRSGASWAGQMVQGEARGFGILSTTDDAFYKGQVRMSGEHVVRWGEGCQVPASRLRSRYKSGIWYDDQLDLQQDYSAATEEQVTFHEKQAEDAAGAAASADDDGAGGDRAPNEHSNGQEAEDAPTDAGAQGNRGADSGQPRIQGRRGAATAHPVCKLFRLRRLLPHDHKEAAEGGHIELLEAAIQRRPEKPWEVRDATAHLLHRIVEAWAHNRKVVMDGGRTDASLDAEHVAQAHHFMEMQELWVQSQNVGPALYFEAYRALGKKRAKDIWRAGNKDIDSDAYKRRWNVNLEDIRTLMKEARLTATEVSLHRNDELAQRGAARAAMRASLRDKAKVDERKLAVTALKKAYALVELRKAELERIDEKLAAEAEYADRQPSPPEPNE